jgi:hypothetical protein
MLQYDLGVLDPGSELALALRAGESLEIVKGAYERARANVSPRRRLVVAFFPHDEMPEESLVSQDGIEFCMPRELTLFLSPYTLDLDEHGDLFFVDQLGVRFEY